MNANTMPLEAETRVLIDRTLQNLGWKLDGKDKNVFMNSRERKRNVKSLAENVPIMCYTPKIAINPLLLLKPKRKVLVLILR